MKKTQEQIVYECLEALGGKARTEQIKIQAMREGVSCADRYLRWMQARGIIQNIGKAKPDDRTDTWKAVAPYITEKEWRENHSDELFDSCNSAENML